jgi:hypothetical protein
VCIATVEWFFARCGLAEALFFFFFSVGGRRVHELTGIALTFAWARVLGWGNVKGCVLGRSGGRAAVGRWRPVWTGGPFVHFFNIHLLYEIHFTFQIHLLWWYPSLFLCLLFSVLISFSLIVTHLYGEFKS